MNTISRRLGLALIAAAAALPFAAPASAAELKKVTFALDWTPNTNHVGMFVAQKLGYFAEAGLDVSILPYTDTAAGTLISTRRADFGVVGVGLYALKARGADLRAVYAIVQSETGRLVVDADRSKVMRPRDLDGLTYGGFGSAWERGLLSTIIKHDGGKGEFKTVTLGTSAYDALSNGRIDFTLEVWTWEGVASALAGQKLREFKYADYGVPDQHTTMIASSDAYLKANPETAKAFLAAVKKGYAYAADHPAEAGDILVEANKAALTNPKLIQASMAELVKGNYLRTAAGVTGKLDPAKMEAIVGYLFKSGILVDADGKVLTTAPDAKDVYSNEFLPKE